MKSSDLDSFLAKKDKISKRNTLLFEWEKPARLATR